MQLPRRLGRGNRFKVLFSPEAQNYFVGFTSVFRPQICFTYLDLLCGFVVKSI